MKQRNAVVGLDIGRFAIKAVWAARRGKRTVIKRAESHRLGQGEQERNAAIRAWIRKAGLTGAPCVLGLPGDLCMFQPLLVMPQDPRTLDQVADMEVIRFNEMASETMSYGFAPFKLNSVERRLLLAMVRPSVLEQALGAVREAGLQIVDVVPTPASLFAALETRAGSDAAPTLYVNVGHAATEIAAGGPGGLMFARSFAAGGRLFSDTLARSRSVPDGKAEALKLAEGSLAAERPMAAELRPAAEMWISELRACLSVYDSLFSGPKFRLKRVVMAGGGAALHGFPEFVSAEMKVEAVRASSWGPTGAAADPLQFAAAAGLAVCGLNAETPTLSLLPSRLREGLLIGQQKPFWIASAATAAVILAVSLVGGYRDFKRMEKHLQAQRESLRRRQQLVAQIENVRTAGEQVFVMARGVQGLLIPGPYIRDLITLLGEAKTRRQRITMICDGASYFPEAPPKKQAARSGRDRARGKQQPETEPEAEKPAFESIIIEGYVREAYFSDVKSLIARLAQLPFVSSADLLSDDRLSPPLSPDDPLAVRGDRRFAIEVKVKES